MNKENIENFTYKELFDFHGYEVDYFIRNSKGKGKISVDKVQDKIYICQNEHDGNKARGCWEIYPVAVAVPFL